MKASEFITDAGVGIITKQNTTPDVKPGETKRQAKKLGMTLDKKNRPPLLHKKAVKNSSPNTLFNLGLSESNADELMAYADKMDPKDIDYKTFIRAAKIARTGKKIHMDNFLNTIDTDPRDKIIDILGETKEAPKGTYFTKTGNLVKGKLTKDAKTKGARETDPKDKIRKKVPKVTQYNEEEDKEFETDLKLPNGKKMVLQADDPKYVRGIVVRSNKDGSYDSYYWIDHPDNVMAIEIKLDDESVKKDAKMIHWAYHPELED